jgi:hypothetical protein
MYALTLKATGENLARGSYAACEATMLAHMHFTGRRLNDYALAVSR